MRKTSIRRSWTVVGVFSAVAVISVLGAAISSADENFGFARLAGNDRYDTAKDVAIKTFGTSDIVVIASGEAFPDALSSAYPAGLGGVPILLTQEDSLPSPTSTAITTLKATKALLVGGTAAISANVEQQLNDDGVETTRVAGENRYDTSADVARSGTPSGVGESGGPLPPGEPTAIVVSGEKFPDALSAGPMSYAQHFPILLTPQAGLAPETKAFLEDEDYGIGAVLIVGGTAAVSQSVQDEIEAMDITVTRIAGANRSDTAVKVADYEVENFEFTNAHVDLARGDGFADALSAAPHGGKAKAPLLLTQDSDTLSDATETWLEDNTETLKDGHILGGTAAVSEDVEEEAEEAGGNTSGTTSSTSSSTTSSTTTTTTVPCPEGQSGPGQPFCFGTATPGEPKFTNAVLTYRTTPTFTNTVTVTYSEAVKCASVDAGDYLLHVTDDPRDAPDPAKDEKVAVFSLTCGNPGSTTSTSVVLTPAKTIGSWREGKVIRVAGTSVVDAGDNPQSTSDTVSWVGPKFKSTIGQAATPGRISVTYDQALDCNSIDPLGSDFAVTKGADKDNQTPLTPTNVTCSGSTVIITLQEPVANNDTGTVKVKSDSVSVTNPKGQLQPTDDCMDWKPGTSISTKALCP